MMSKHLVREEKHKNFLLVEGMNDVNVFHHLLDCYQIPARFQRKGESFKILNHRGVDNLLKKLGIYLKVDEPSRYGIIIDADIDLAIRWRQLRGILERSDYRTIPIHPNPEGTILKEEGRPVVGIWLMPDNQVTGMLEDFVRFLVPPNDLLWPMAEEIVQKVKAIETDKRFRGAHESKARIHTWLAWQKRPGVAMGVAIAERYLDANVPYVQQLISWILQLFDLGQA